MFFKATKKCVNAELVRKVQNSKSNSILYGQKQPLKYLPRERYSGDLKQKCVAQNLGELYVSNCDEVDFSKGITDCGFSRHSAPKSQVFNSSNLIL